MRLDHLLKRNIRKIQILYLIFKFISSVIPIYRDYRPVGRPEL